ncbi:hypothetical protein EV421DRAFT_201369 [Armillaria borealis]|uniref:Uncharacterized protein n=1 Tax=Armillaria borealis TaxID=47425 RepID=A0AA39MEQ0_9AGAR|nr:hypothetical protein EV421DRAFT_201369 [Armillaria borealis]
MAVKHQLYWQNENSTSRSDLALVMSAPWWARNSMRLGRVKVQGRSVILDEPVSVEELVGRVERHLGLSQVQVEYPSSVFLTVAICTEPGGSMLIGRDVDVYFTISCSSFFCILVITSILIPR